MNGAVSQNKVGDWDHSGDFEVIKVELMLTCINGEEFQTLCLLPLLAVIWHCNMNTGKLESISPIIITDTWENCAATGARVNILFSWA
jgi:hypothetical protein